MKWTARRKVRLTEKSAQSEGKWDRWFAWYPVAMATAEDSPKWVWLEFVERKWSTSRYGVRSKFRYRLPDNSKPNVQQRLRNLAELTRKLDAILARSDTPQN